MAAATAAIAGGGLPITTTTRQILVQPACHCPPEIPGDRAVSPGPSVISRDESDSVGQVRPVDEIGSTNSNNNSNVNGSSGDDSSSSVPVLLDSSSMHNYQGSIAASSNHSNIVSSSNNHNSSSNTTHSHNNGGNIMSNSHGRSVRHSTANVLMTGRSGLSSSARWQRNVPITAQPPAHRSLTGASSTSTSRPDPMLELLGWRAEPLLCRRLRLYIVEGSFELAAVIVAVYLSQEFLSPRVLFARLLLLPLVVVALKFFWSLRLAMSYYLARKRDVAEVIQNMGAVHSRAFWSCSAATLTCLSCVLMVWHSIMFLLMTGYGGSSMHPGEEFAARYVLLESALFVLVNWLIWRDFVNHYKECPEEPEDVKLLMQILRLHRCRAISLVPYKDIKDQDETSNCIVCLDAFKEKDRVARLPCGHIFHPSCAHRWIIEDWRCPFRCSLDCNKIEKQKGSTPEAISTEHSTTSTALPEQHSGVSGEHEVDLEAGSLPAARSD
eukprot:CAMPEP_0206495172 /NCGR_PEP_ID=MMETSP0324_2-20121206/48284_1 /ASSEMBLY_ACC=CAM_ASM_000836 /TAXON_ID=2866 /ORGANISM="Crypthecodinium cohnii, Strain Seligo" /LENGTH=495 /DNA_ID=CAMNT_0053979205 /DNA_START=120 /DNA_END=1607 /DNA_ORIENTATION=+